MSVSEKRILNLIATVHRLDDLYLFNPLDAPAGRQIAPQSVALLVNRRIDFMDWEMKPTQEFGFLVEVHSAEPDPDPTFGEGRGPEMQVVPFAS